MRFIKLFLTALLFMVVASSSSFAEDSQQRIQLDVKEFSLKNGMQFLVVERHATPQVACRIAIRAGSALEEAEKTGIAHLLEHMMFKGTNNFGTLDPVRDKALQEAIEAAYQEVLAEERKRNPDRIFIKSKLAEMEKLRAEVQQIYVPQAFSSQLGRNGAIGVNAYTSWDQTQYMMSVPSDMIEQWFSIVSEQLFEPAWREFYVEREVVLREWAYRYVNNPEGAAWLDLYSTAYNAHPYRNPTIGWKSDIERLSATDAQAYHRRYYNPTNAVCVLVGDVSVKEVRRLAGIYFERYPAGERAPEKVTREPAQGGHRRSIRFLKGARTPIVRIGFHAAAMGTDDFYALDVMTMVLSQGRGARMTQEIVNKGRAVDAWAYNPDNRYAGMIVLGGSPNEPEDIKKPGFTEKQKGEAYLRACEALERTLLKEAEKLKTERVSDRELKRIKKLTHRDFLDRMRTNEALAGTLATLEVQTGWQYLMTYLDRIEQITPEDVMRVAQEYLDNQGKTSIFVIPGGRMTRAPEPYEEVRSLSGVSAVGAFKADTSVNHSIYPTPRGWKHPLSFDRKPQTITYPEAQEARVKGAKVFYLPDHELPLIDMVILLKAGAVDVPRDRMGLDQIFERCLIQGGTTKYSPSELAVLLDENAIQLSLSVNEEEAVIRLSVMKEDWDMGLSLLREIITRPGFDPEIFNVAKEQALIALERQGGDAQAVSMREAMIWRFKGHPYGRDPLHALQTIPGITREDIQDFLTAYFVPSNMVACVAGDIDKKQVLKALGQLFSALPERKAPRRHLEDPLDTPPVLALIHKPGQVQSQVTLDLASVKRSHPDYWKMSLLINVFGGKDSLMYTRLRDDLGLVYAAWFHQAFKWQAGLLLGYIGCKAERTADAISETVKIMNSLRKNVPEKELERKRLDVLNSFVFTVDTPAALVEVYGRYHMRKEPLDTLERIQEAFISVNKDQLQALAVKFLDPNRLQIFVVADETTGLGKEGGTKASLEEGLKALGRDLGLPYREMVLR
jgi:predicted Zn-dependent peptidase